MTFTQLVHHPATLNIVRCVLLNAVPVVALAIYASTRAEEEHAQATESPRGEDEVKLELQQIHTAYSLTLIGQILTYIVAYGVSPLPYHLTWVVFVGALLAQGQLKFSMERRVRKLEAKPVDHFHATTRAFLFLLLALAAYAGLVHGSVVSSGWLAHRLHLSENWGAAVRVGFTFGGVFAGLFLAFAGLPWYLKRLLPSRKIDDSRLIDRLDTHFRKAGLTPPRYWLLELDTFGVHNALIAGLRLGRGAFSPTLFLSKSLVNDFTAAEFDAVVLHEVSHLKLRHMRNRLLLTLGVLTGAAATALLVMGVALMWLPREVALVPVLFAAFLPSFAPYFFVRRQVHRQELEADSYAVFTLGAELEGLANALRRLDELNDKLRQEAQSSPAQPKGSHPATELRIAALHQEQKRRSIVDEEILDKAA